MDKLKFLTRAILAGFMIGIGGAVYLSLDIQVVGAVLFSFGLLTIVTSRFSLYTGMVGFAETIEDFIDLIVVLAGNFAGTLLASAMIQASNLPICPVELCEAKLSKEPSEIFILSMLCGILMYLAVAQYKKIRKPIYIIFPVTIFILCGFEHSVANMFYFLLANVGGYKVYGYIILMILGNGMGAILFRNVQKIAKYD